MRRHILFVINPNAGRGTAEMFESQLREELARLPLVEQDVRVETYVPDSPDEMRETLREKLQVSSIDALGVVGGDGSVMEVLPVLMEFPEVPMALIPYGTGNLLAANLGISRELPEALETLLNGQPRRIDIGRIGEHYFALLAGVGTVAEIMENTSSRRKQVFGPWAYLVDGIKTILRTEKCLITIRAENRIYKSHGVSVVISNAATFMDPCLALTPEAQPDDGLLDVCFIRAKSKRDYVPAILEAWRRPHKKICDRKIVYFQTRKLRIESSRPLKVQADGNIIGTTPVDVEIIRNRLRVLVPPSELEAPSEASRSASEASLQTLLAGLLR